MRGNQPKGGRELSARGSIPACAGEPRCVLGESAETRVYPRVCGGTFVPTRHYEWVRGLSPRVRGNLGIRSANPGNHRSIPACAGEPMLQRRLCGSRTVYPRVCGGTCLGKVRKGNEKGLSPRVRGNRGDKLKADHVVRSIPACAGEPRAAASCSSSIRVYPRVCGGTHDGWTQSLLGTGLSPRVRGNLPAPPMLSRRKGLSPRVRGNQLGGRLRLRPLRSIPACAGEPQHHALGARPGQVYPRVCGEPRRPLFRVDDGMVYPRVCGGTMASEGEVLPYWGLSPRVRGNLLSLIVCVRLSRSIPACAGEPIRAILYPSHTKVYPRVCGGTRQLPAYHHSLGGLSPRVRGNHVSHEECNHQPRSIPACAGEPSSGSSRGSSRRVYPRVCGGTHRWGWRMALVEGLSPRVRGNRVKQSLEKIKERSIPACAGEPLERAFDRTHRTVYPRVCGGTRLTKCWKLAIEGLSPRVRGNPDMGTGEVARDRSIPACAGEPRGAYSSNEAGPVYPRVCGGTYTSNFIPIAYQGLSPRVRGNPAASSLPSLSRGSIPACAGEPCIPRGMQPPATVYPRVCGGTLLRLITRELASGLSPRVRGNPSMGVENGSSRGSIPACAGEPCKAVPGENQRTVYPRVCGGTARACL